MMPPLLGNHIKELCTLLAKMMSSWLLQRLYRRWQCHQLNIEYMCTENLTDDQCCSNTNAISHNCSFQQGIDKSTQIPAYISNSGILEKFAKAAVSTVSSNSPNNHKLGRSICVTQPRRVAAITLATRVSSGLNCTPGTIEFVLMIPPI